MNMKKLVFLYFCSFVLYLHICLEGFGAAIVYWEFNLVCNSYSTYHVTMTTNCS